MKDLHRILLVEDSEDLARVLAMHLKDLGFALDHASSGEEGLSMALSGDYTLLILDVMLGGIDGFEVLRRVREKNEDIAVMMLTSRSEEIDKIVGLNSGADDYMTKPFQVGELLARINALLRRAELGMKSDTSGGDPVVKVGPLTVDAERRRVILEGNELELTTKEFDLLYLMASHPGKAFTRGQLLDQVWGYESGEYEHVVNNLILRLRKKLEKDLSNPLYIETVRGVGYRFAELDRDLSQE